MDDRVKPQYLRVRNWERFQHYKDRKPPWIKYHVEMLDNYELTSLSVPTQLIYDRLLLLAAKTDNNIPNDHGWISAQTFVDQATVQEAVETLLLEGFLSLSESKRAASKKIAARNRVSSKTLPSRASARSRETEVETEAEVEGEKEQQATPVTDVRRVYDYWREKRGKARGNYERMSDGRRKKIQARLKEFSADDLCRAIDGIALDPWEGRAMQDDLTIVFRSTEQVDKFLELAATGGNVQGAAAHNEFQAYMRQKLEVVNGG